MNLQELLSVQNIYLRLWMNNFPCNRVSLNFVLWSFWPTSLFGKNHTINSLRKLQTKTQLYLIHCMFNLFLDKHYIQQSIPIKVMMLKKSSSELPMVWLTPATACPIFFPIKWHKEHCYPHPLDCDNTSMQINYQIYALEWWGALRDKNILWQRAVSRMIMPRFNLKWPPYQLITPKVLMQNSMNTSKIAVLALPKKKNHVFSCFQIANNKRERFKTEMWFLSSETWTCTDWQCRS